MTKKGLNPLLPEGFGYQSRPLNLEDQEDLLSLLELAAEESSSDSPTRAGISQILERLGERLRTDSLVILSEDGDPIAVALVFLPPASPDEEVASLLGVVRPDHHGRGLGASLLCWMEARVRNARISDERLKRMRVSCDLGSQARVSLFEKQGFAPVLYILEMRMQLHTPSQEPTLPSDLSIIPWANELSDCARSAFNSAFEGHNGLSAVNEEMWVRRFVGVPKFRPDLSWLVVYERDVVGFCVNWVNPDAEHSLSSQGWIEAIGVIPEWRGRGVADAMMVRSLNTFLEHGLSKAALDVDTKNLTGALQLYEKHGFAPAKQDAVFEKLLD